MTSTALADTLPSSIPKLDASGLNWAVFSLRFQDAVEAKGFWGHFDGTDQKLATTIPYSAADIEKWEKDK